MPVKISHYAIWGRGVSELFSHLCHPRFCEIPATWTHFSYTDECPCEFPELMDSSACQRDHTITIGRETILHNEAGSNYIGKKGLIIQVGHDVVDGINTTGAGDMLAAEIIAVKLKGQKLKDHLKQCHLNVKKELEERAKKLQPASADSRQGATVR